MLPVRVGVQSARVQDATGRKIPVGDEAKDKLTEFARLSGDSHDQE
jgi:hypothetical protein